MLSSDTIASRISAPGLGAIAVVRVSGERATEVLTALTGRQELLQKPREATLVKIRDLIGEDTLDHALAIFFKAPNSYTGEDSFELSLHGSTYIVDRLFSVLSSLGVRQARPGEFTERAYLNGKLDLTQAEAVADLISAETEAQARVAREQLEGKLSGVITQIGTPLRELLAQIEAYIDFPEEGIEPLRYEDWSVALAAVQTEVRRYIGSYSEGKLLRDGASVVLVGVPNAGKSSLLNALLGESRAIVTEIAGTTRDTIEERISIDGVLVRLCDTAGLVDETKDSIEAIGIERSWGRAKRADLILFVYDPTQEELPQREMWDRVSKLDVKILEVVSKADVETRSEPPNFLLQPTIVSSERTLGLSDLRKRIVETLIGGRRESLLISSARHFEALKKASSSLDAALAAVSGKIPPEFVSIDIRAALSALEEIVGVTTSEEVLGIIFSRFCIGK